MKTNKFEVSLKDASTGKEHSFTFHQSNKSGPISLTVNGIVVAEIDVGTMTKDVRDDEGDYHTKLSENFYINFHAKDPVAKADCSAMVWVEPFTKS